MVKRNSIVGCVRGACAWCVSVCQRALWWPFVAIRLSVVSAFRAGRLRRSGMGSRLDVSVGSKGGPAGTPRVTLSLPPGPSRAQRAQNRVPRLAPHQPNKPYRALTHSMCRAAAGSASRSRGTAQRVVELCTVRTVRNGTTTMTIRNAD